jgi:anti-anti-sigma regulatory factor
MLTVVRAHGSADARGKPSLSDHACRLFGADDQPSGFQDAAVAFLSHGQALGQRLVVVADRRHGADPPDLSALGDVEAMVHRGELVVHDFADLDPAGGPVDASRQLAVLSMGVDSALAAGWSGLRVVADATAQVAEPCWCDGHLRWEHLIDRYMVDHPLAVMCAYDVQVVGAESAGALACVHPLRHDRDTPFALYATPDGVALEGEVDARQAPLLERALAALPPRDSLVVNARGTTFVDAAATGVLARYAARRAAAGAVVSVRDAGPALARVWELLDCPEIGSPRLS